MNFYTSIFNITFKPKKWAALVLIVCFLLIGLIGVFNYIIDPYDVTKHNIFNIKYKFANDDRTEKVNYFASLKPVDNILIGSSRVYSIDPKIVTQEFKGTTYNFGVGTATIEDSLGILIYLQRNHKLPKRLFLGIDLYTLNSDLPINKYFLRNKELNFLSNPNNTSQMNWSHLVSLDATRASVKTLNYHLFPDENAAPRFTKDGQGYSPEWSDLETHKMLTTKEAIDFFVNSYSNGNYKQLDPIRLKYLLQIKEICKKENIKLYVFTTPLHPILLQKIQNSNVKYAMSALDNFLLTHFEHFHNFYIDNNFTSNLKNFSGATHSTNKAGDLIIKTIKDQS